LIPKQRPLKALPLSRTKKLQQHLLLKQTPSQLSDLDTNDDDCNEEVDFHRSYSRPKLVIVDLWDDDAELPEHITQRLAEIREQALQKYREVCYNKA
jgi:hypothetical protein